MASVGQTKPAAVAVVDLEAASSLSIMSTPLADIESTAGTLSIPYRKLLLDQGIVTSNILGWSYDGRGTEDEPYLVTWIENDPRNPLLFPRWRKWIYSVVVSFATLSVSFASSVYMGGVQDMIQDFHVSEEVITMGLSLFVLGFAAGPLLWAPMSELYGRQVLYAVTFGAFVVFNLGITVSQNIWSVLVLRFLAGSFGSSPLSNSGGFIADLFSAEERGTAMTLFCIAPLMGPVLGPMAGQFIGESQGWRWISCVITIFTGALWILGILIVPETFPLVLLRKRAERLSKMTGKVYISRVEAERGEITISKTLRTELLRPWMLFFHEPIVAFLSIYSATVTGILYLLFAAIPIVYVEKRGWTAGVGGLAFVGIAVGLLFSSAYALTIDKKQYGKATASHGWFAPPEARLVACMVGGCALPVGMFWFAWTNSPTIPWPASIAATIIFGFGMGLVFMSILNYLVDAYTIYAASALAAVAVMRSIFGAVFPLFTTQMYDKLGIHWASSILAFLALACLPLPFIFRRHGASIRRRCRFAHEADETLRKVHAAAIPVAIPVDTEMDKGEPLS